MAEEEDKTEAEKGVEEKKKEAPWWQKIHPVVAGGGILAGYLILRSMMLDEENRGTYMFWLLALGAFIYFLTRPFTPKEEEIIRPYEAELLVEKECARKKSWGQFKPMAQYHVDPVSNLHHKDSVGLFYDVSVTVHNPYDRPDYYIGRVIAKGPERGFTTLSEHVGRLTGRERPPEKTILPPWLLKIQKYPELKEYIKTND